MKTTLTTYVPTTRAKVALLGLCFLLATHFLPAEGSKNLLQDPVNGIVMLETGRDAFGNFAAFDSEANGRLIVTIANPGELVYLGLAEEYTDEGTPFGGVRRPNNSSYNFRIRRINEDGSATVVHGPFRVNNSTANVTSSAQAEFGQYDVTRTVNGQLVYVFAPQQAGNYSIEFEDSTTDDEPWVSIPFWDITVVNQGQVQPGRLWSRNWNFRTPRILPLEEPECVWNREFQGSFYSYTADGFVSRINFEDSGMQGLSFTIAFNSTGPGSTGELEIDRMSIPDSNATQGTAEHRIFLDLPDERLFPSGRCGEISADNTFTCDEDEGYCLEVTLTRRGQLEVLLDFNGNGEFDQNSLDVLQVVEVPKISGQDTTLCIPWDGLRGDSTAVSFMDTVDIVITYAQGVQHWAAYDVEYMKNGFCVETVRPSCTPTLESDILYWDDRNIPEDPGTGAEKDQREGCECATDCRSWNFFQLNAPSCEELDDNATNGYGDKNTLNTYWFARSTQETIASVPAVAASIVGPADLCPGDTTTLSVDGIQLIGQPSYFWTGPNINGATTPTINVFAAGEYCVVVSDDQGCTFETCRTVTVFDVNETDEFPDEFTICQGEPRQLDEAGSDSFTYRWSPTTGIDDPTSAQPTFFPNETTEYTVTVRNELVEGQSCETTERMLVVVVQDVVISVPSIPESCEETVTLVPTVVPETPISLFTQAGEFISTGTSFTIPLSGTELYEFRASTEAGCSDTLRFLLRGGPAEISLPDTSLFCLSDGVDLAVTNLDPNDTLTYLWTPIDLFDPATLDAASPTFIGAPGEYEVAVTATNQAGCAATATTILVVIDENGTLDFNAEVSCTGTQVDFTSSGTIDYGLRYDFGDGNSSTEINPTHTYAQPGTYTVTLSLVYDQDCVMGISKEVTVVDNVLSADFSTDRGDCENGSVTIDFTNTTFNATGDDLIYAWTFTGADQTVSTEESPSVTVSQSGTVTALLLVTAGDCSDEVERSFTVSLPEINLPADIVICEGDSAVLNAIAEDGLNYNWSPSPDFDANDPTPITRTAGEYSVTVTDPNADFSCAATATTTVTIADSIGLVIVGPDGPVGDGGAAGSGGDDMGGSDDSDDSDDNDDGDIVLPTITTCGETVPLSVDLTNGAGVSVVYTRPDGTVLGDGTNITLTTPNGRDTVIVTAMNAAGCTESDTVIIINRQVDATIGVGADDISVCGATDTTLTVVNFNDGDELTYAWMANDIINGPLDGASVDLTTPESGSVDLSVVVTNQFGCDTTIGVTISTLPFTPNDYPEVLVVCAGDPTVVDGGNPVDGYVYDWSPADALDRADVASPTGTFTEGTDLTVTITDPATGCSATRTVSVDVQEAVIVTTDPAEVTLCDNGSVTATASSDNSNVVFTWYSDAQLTQQVAEGATYTIEADGPGDFIFFVRGVDAETGCNDVETVRVSVTPFTPNTYPEQLTTCPGEPLTVPGGDAVDGYDYVWSPSDDLDLSDPANPVFTGDDDVTLSVTITDPGSGCTSTQEVDIDVAPQINLMSSPADTSLCALGTVTATAGSENENVTITWYSDAELTDVVASGGSFDFTPEMAGTFTFFIQGLDTETNCSEVNNLTVSVTEFTPNSYPEQLSTCPGEPLTIPGGDAVPGYGYAWSPNDDLDLTDPTNPVFLGDEDATLTITISDPGTECLSVQEVEIDVAPRIDLMSTPADTSLCALGTVTASAGSENADVAITWYSDAELTDEVASGDGFTFTPDTAGVYTFFIEGLDTVSNCSEVNTLTVNVSEFTPNIYAETVVACAEQATTIPGGDAVDGYVYDWMPADDLDLSDPANPVGTFTEDTQLTVTITDPATECELTQVVNVSVAPAIMLTTGPVDTTLCEPGTVNATASSPNENVDLTWYADAALTDSIGSGENYTIEAGEAGVMTTVFVNAVDAETGCNQLSTVSVNVSPITLGLPMESIDVCAGEGGDLFGGNGPTPGLTYTYTPDGLVDLSDPANPVFVGTEDAVLTVDVVDPATGCTAQVEVTATVSSLGELTGTADPETISLGESSTLTVEGCAGDDCVYSWSVPIDDISATDLPSVVATPTESGVFVYVATVTNGACQDEVEIELRVEDTPCDPDQIYIPNAFTPNGDNMNDVLRVRSRFAELLTEFEWIIYDRWGQEVFTTTDINEGWDGIFEGDDLEPDVYGYWLRVVCPNGEPLIQQGNVSILR